MAAIFFASNQGASGRFNSDFVVGTASSAGSDFELRVTNPTAGGNVPTKKDVILFLKNVMWFIDNNEGSNVANYPRS
jgi:hypothetical protein